MEKLKTLEWEQAVLPKVSSFLKSFNGVTLTLMEKPSVYTSPHHENRKIKGHLALPSLPAQSASSEGKVVIVSIMLYYYFLKKLSGILTPAPIKYHVLGQYLLNTESF